MRNTILRTMLGMLLLPPGMALAQGTNAYAYGYFNGPDGLALVEVVRSTDSSGVVSSQLFYTFCGQPTASACQQGSGTIPNSTVTGGINASVTKPSVLSVNVDTSTVAGFINTLCTSGMDYDANCLGPVAATGGLVNVTWTKTNAWANVSSSSLRSYTLGKLTGGGTSTLSVFSATQQGTVIGVNAGSGAVMTTGTDASVLKVQFQAKRVGVAK